MNLNNAARVGITVLAAAALLVYATFSLRGSAKGDTYLRRVAFGDAQGIQDGAYVRVRGVDKGQVKSVDLSGEQAILTLRIKNDYQLKPDDSIRIVGGLFSFSPPYVEITPGARSTPMTLGRDGLFSGEATPSTEKIVSQSERLLQNLNVLTERMSSLVESVASLAGDRQLKRNMVDLTWNLQKASASGVVIARNMEGVTAKADRLLGGFQGSAAELNRTMKETQGLLKSFRRTADASHEVMTDARGLVQGMRDVAGDTRELVRNTNETIKNAGGLVTDTRAALTDNKEKLAAVLDNLNRSLKTLDETLTATRSFLGDEDLRGNLKDTASNLKEATENLKKIAADVQGITGDPKVQQDLKDTVGSLKGVSRQAGEVLERARTVLGSGGKAAKSIGQRLQDAELDVALMRVFRAERNRLDLNASILWSKSTFYRAGFYDFGEANKFNLQAGQLVRPGITARYGFYASKLGGGLDFGRLQHPAFSLDLFGVDRPQLDLRARVPVTAFLDLTLGLDDLFDHPDPVVGMRYRR